MVDEVRRADLVLLEEQLVPDPGRDGALEQLPVVVGVLTHRSAHAELPRAGVGKVDRSLAEAEGVAQGHRDDVHDGVQLQAGLKLVARG